MKIRHLWAVLLLSIPVFSMEGEENLLLRQLSDGFSELLEADNLTRENFLALIEKNRLLVEENNILRARLKEYETTDFSYQPQPKKRKIPDDQVTSFGPSILHDNIQERFPQPIYNKKDRSLNQFNGAQVFVSPSKPKSDLIPKTSIVYTMTAVEDPKDAYIEPESRIDASNLVEGAITDANLHEVLWKTEKALLEQVEQDKLILSSNVYVGVTGQTMEKRASEHFSALRKSVGKEEVLPPMKEQILIRALLSGFHVRISRLIHNIPKNKEKVFEVLVTHVLLGQESGGCAVSGNVNARAEFSTYYSSEFRNKKLAEDAKFAQLVEMRENLAKEQFLRKVAHPRRKLEFSEEN